MSEICSDDAAGSSQQEQKRNNSALLHVHDRQQLASACFVSCVEKGLKGSEAAEFGFLFGSSINCAKTPATRLEVVIQIGFSHGSGAVAPRECNITP